MERIYELQADILKTLANPRRLEMAHLLMRTAGVVEAERDGREICYRLADPDIIAACNLMRAALQRRLTRLAELATMVADAPTPVAAGNR